MERILASTFQLDRILSRPIFGVSRTWACIFVLILRTCKRSTFELTGGWRNVARTRDENIYKMQNMVIMLHFDPGPWEGTSTTYVNTARAQQQVTSTIDVATSTIARKPSAHELPAQTARPPCPIHRALSGLVPVVNPQRQVPVPLTHRRSQVLRKGMCCSYRDDAATCMPPEGANRAVVER